MQLSSYRFLAVCAVVVVMALCTVFYAIGNVGTRDQLTKDYQLPSITFNFVFALGDLYLVLFCFIYVIYTIDISSISFILPVTVMLVSFVMLYIKLYFSLKTGDVNYTEVQTFAFNIFVNAAIIIINVVLTSKRFISATIAMLPMIFVSLYFLYIGHQIAKN